MNETPMMFSGLEAQGEMNRMEELLGGPERIYHRSGSTGAYREDAGTTEYRVSSPSTRQRSPVVPGWSAGGRSSQTP